MLHQNAYQIIKNFIKRLQSFLIWRKLQSAKKRSSKHKVLSLRGLFFAETPPVQSSVRLRLLNSGVLSGNAAKKELFSGEDKMLFCMKYKDWSAEKWDVVIFLTTPFLPSADVFIFSQADSEASSDQVAGWVPQMKNEIKTSFKSQGTRASNHWNLGSMVQNTQILIPSITYWNFTYIWNISPLKPLKLKVDPWTSVYHKKQQNIKLTSCCKVC